MTSGPATAAQAGPEQRPAVAAGATGRPRRRRNVGPADFEEFSTAALKREYTRRRRLAAAQRDVRASARSQTGRYKENPEFLAAVLDMLRAAGTRVGDLDIGNLAQLDAIVSEAKGVLGRAVWNLHEGRDGKPGFSWQQIGDALGVRKESAFRRFAPWRPAGAPRQEGGGGMTRQPSEGRMAYNDVAEELSGAQNAAQAGLILRCLDEGTLLAARDYARRAHQKWPPRPQTSGWQVQIISTGKEEKTGGQQQENRPG